MRRKNGSVQKRKKMTRLGVVNEPVADQATGIQDNKGFCCDEVSVVERLVTDQNRRKAKASGRKTVKIVCLDICLRAKTRILRVRSLRRWEGLRA
jgi:hypothetical protein